MVSEIIDLRHGLPLHEMCRKIALDHIRCQHLQNFYEAGSVYCVKLCPRGRSSIAG